MNETTKRFLAAVAQDPTLTEPQKLLIQIIADLNERTIDQVIDRLAQAEPTTPPPVPEKDRAQH